MILLQAAETATTLGGLVNKLGDKFFIRLLIDLASIFILLFLIYLPNNKKREYIFTFLIFNVAIFNITFLMNDVQMSMGAAFGLFAVFGMLRYRTEDIIMKDMTYLFLSIAFGMITAVTKGDWEPAIVAGIILLLTFLLDSGIILKRELYKNIQYENIEMIKPENEAALMEDLRKRTGLNIHRIAVGRVDFLRDTATVRIYYYETKNPQKK